MGDELPGGAQIPVRFQPGQPLTAEELNKLETELLRLILTHTHEGDDAHKAQGVRIDAKAIAPNAVERKHIADKAVAREHLTAGAVGAAEIGEKQIGANHLMPDSVATSAVKNGSITPEKLSADLLALVNAPRDGASTYGYCQYLDPIKVFPRLPSGTKWYDTIIRPDVPIQMHDLPVVFARDGGGYQILDTIVPPKELKDRLPTVIDKPTIPRIDLPSGSGGGITPPKGSGDGTTPPIISLPTSLLPNLKTNSALNAALSADAASSSTQSLARNALTAANSLDAGALSSTAASTTPAPYSPALTEALLTGSSLASTSLSAASTGYVPSDNLIQRSKVSLAIDPATYKSPTSGSEEVLVLQPGAGGNAVFSSAKEPTLFQAGVSPSEEVVKTVQALFYNYGIDANASEVLQASATNQKLIDFLNNPHLLPVGYWTGTSRNVESVTRLKNGTSEVVRVAFSIPYLSASGYTVNVQPELRNPTDPPVVPVVCARTREYVDIAFYTWGANGIAYSNMVNFSIVVLGELASAASSGGLASL